MTKSEIIAALAEVKSDLTGTIEAYDTAKLFEIKPTTWNCAEHAEHLYYSIKPLTQAFMLPKFIFRYKFGKPNRKSRTYNELVERYLEKLKGNTFPNGNPFGPKANVKFTKEMLLHQLNSQYDKLGKQISKKWNDENLENYLLPHPLLGKLTVREMLMFTIYHTKHHLKAIK